MSNSLNEEVGDLVIALVTDGATPPVITTGPARSAKGSVKA